MINSFKGLQKIICLFNNKIVPEIILPRMSLLKSIEKRIFTNNKRLVKYLSGK